MKTLNIITAAEIIAMDSVHIDILAASVSPCVCLCALEVLKGAWNHRCLIFPRRQLDHIVLNLPSQAVLYKLE